MSDAPYFKFWAKDWRSSESIQLMSLAERGAFLELLAVAWLSSEEPCTIPSDDTQLAMLLHCPVREWRRISARVLAEFEAVESGRLRNAKLYRVYCEMQAKHDRQSQGGKRGASKRWVSHKDTDNSPNGSPSDLPNGVVKPKPLTARARARDRTKREDQKLPASQAPAGGSAVQTTDVTPRNTAVSTAASWTARLTHTFTTLGGTVTYGQLGQALKPYVETHGEPQVDAAMRLWIEFRKARGQPCKFSYFADDIVQWIERAANLSVIDGEMNVNLEMLSRPVGIS